MQTVKQSHRLADVVSSDVQELRAPILQVLSEHFGEQANVLRKLAVRFLTYHGQCQA